MSNIGVVSLPKESFELIKKVVQQRIFDMEFRSGQENPNLKINSQYLDAQMALSILKEVSPSEEE